MDTTFRNVYMSYVDLKTATAIETVQFICSKHNCWIDWDNTDIYNKQFSIDGKSEESLIDCAEEMDRVLSCE